jgi:DNA-binding transcriptional ArsR family regulator
VTSDRHDPERDRDGVPWPAEPPPEADSGGSPAGNVRRLPRRGTDTGGGERPDPAELGAAMRAQLLTADQLMTLPRPEPLIDGILVQNSLAVLYGRYGSGKSFTALDWALCASQAMPWQGREVRNPGRRPVIYVAAEGLDGLRKRVRAWRECFNVPELPGFLIFPKPIYAMDPRDHAAAEAMAATVDPALVVLDTYARTMTGGEENSARDTGRAIELADRVRRASGGCVLYVAHTGKDDELRGSTALPGAADTLIRQRKSSPAKGRATVTLTCDKQKDDRPFAELSMELRVIDLGDETSCVLQASQEPVRPSATISDRERAILATLRLLCETNQGMSWTRLQEASEIPKATFARHLKALVGRGLVCVDGAGKTARYHLAESGPSPDGPTVSPPSQTVSLRPSSEVSHGLTPTPPPVGG